MSTYDRCRTRASSATSPPSIHARASSGLNSGHTRTTGISKRRWSPSSTRPSATPSGTGTAAVGDPGARRLVEVVGIRALERVPSWERHRTVGEWEEIGVARPVADREPADHDDLPHTVRAAVGCEPRQGRCCRVADDGHRAGRCIDGRQHRGELVGQRRLRVPVVRARQRDRDGIVTTRSQLVGDVGPHIGCEPEAGDEDDVHAPTVEPVPDDRLPVHELCC